MLGKKLYRVYLEYRGEKGFENCLYADSEMDACEKSEREMQVRYRGDLMHWFAYKVEKMAD